MQSGVVSNVIDGNTLLVDIADTGASERVRLIGVGISGEEAVSYLTSFIGQPVTLEPDAAHPDDNRLRRYVWVTDANGLPAMANDLLIEQGLAPYEAGSETGRFDAMLATIGGSLAPAAGIAGSAAEQDASPVGASAPVELTEADRAYLAELSRTRDNLRLSLEYYDLYLIAPNFDEAYFAHLGVFVLGWSVFCDGIDRLEPTPQFADLHTRYLAACQPFDALAHQIEPGLDQMLAGETPSQPFAEIDVVLEAAGIAAAVGPIR
jgi:hypothetical protein